MQHSLLLLGVESIVAYHLPYGFPVLLLNVGIVILLVWSAPSEDKRLLLAVPLKMMVNER